MNLAPLEKYLDAERFSFLEPEDLVPILQEMFSECEVISYVLTHAAETKDLDLIDKSLHKLKGVAESFGWLELHEKVIGLRNGLESLPDAQISSGIIDLEAYVHQVLKEFQVP